MVDCCQLAIIPFSTVQKNNFDVEIAKQNTNDTLIFQESHQSVPT